MAEPIPGPTTERLTELAARHNMLIQAGMAERAMDGNIVYNSAVLIGPQGVIGVFRKLHNQFEWPVFSPGDHLSVFETRLGKIGMFICYDLAFPEIIRAFALQGATIAALTTAWPMKGDDPETDYYGYTYDILSRANGPGQPALDGLLEPGQPATDAGLRQLLRPQPDHRPDRQDRGRARARRRDRQPPRSISRTASSAAAPSISSASICSRIAAPSSTA